MKKLLVIALLLSSCHVVRYELAMPTYSHKPHVVKHKRFSFPLIVCSGIWYTMSLQRFPLILQWMDTPSIVRTPCCIMQLGVRSYPIRQRSPGSTCGLTVLQIHVREKLLSGVLNEKFISINNCLLYIMYALWHILLEQYKVFLLSFLLLFINIFFSGRVMAKFKR